MEFIKENKVVLIICFSLLLLSVLILFLISTDIFDDNDYLEINEYLKNYKINEIVPISMNEEQMARKYLADYTKLIILDPKKAYDLLNPEYRAIRFPTQKDFENHFEDLLSDRFYNVDVTSYNVFSKGGYKQFYVVDANDNTFIFNEYSIMNYDVMFDVVTI